MTCVVDDETVPPLVVRKPRGQKRTARGKSISEGGFKPKRPPNPLAQTQKNKSNSLEGTLLREVDQPVMALRQLRSDGYGYGYGPTSPAPQSMVACATDLIGGALIATGVAMQQK
ncbi:hypothetical protein B484DRAFT_440469 [Ochromonadaceae sp. CCMP2298]|nr:hypothetical protein B484DRAFT_440469 [Ochromonadaceae sp. CCMP2298]